MSTRNVDKVQNTMSIKILCMNGMTYAMDAFFVRVDNGMLVIKAYDIDPKGIVKTYTKGYGFPIVNVQHYEIVEHN